MKSFDLRDDEHKLSDYIGNKIGCITKARMKLISGRWYIHTCCHGWVEVSGILQGKVIRYHDDESWKHHVEDNFAFVKNMEKEIRKELMM